ncbi:hypothetical protein EXIGLDRAFT_841105 [Exidia glandulosa HHB12029]|uniref:BTB domain-containing protein n=1 Tax=Exidia glandulosa HHB12029 TaxID=1314781 RepID=A0A165E2L9_EXIGL|nr:hypothetical protein EXIGLDRAFT_841105 [Exidia glandulosa HHB12029]
MSSLAFESTVGSDGVVSQDAIYYESDGNVILRAENTLFKVHKSRLTKMSTVFQDLLALPQGDRPGEGGSDENPVKLAHDTAEQVRSLLWALYARPDEIAEYIADNNVDDERWLRLLHVVRLAHKYDCLGLARWALDAVAQHCRTPESVGTTAIVTAIIQLYPLREQLPGLDDWAGAFIQRSWVRLELDDLALLRAAAVAHWFSLERNIYCGLVRKTASHWSKLALVPQEQARLLAGYHNLNEVLMKLPSLTFDIEHPSCSTDREAGSCEANWKLIWHECCFRANRPFLEVLPRLQVIEMALDSVGDGKEPVSRLVWSPRGVYTTSPLDPVVQQVPLPRCWKEYRRATKKLFEQVDTIIQTCFDESTGLIDTTSPALEALWLPTRA